MSSATQRERAPAPGRGGALTPARIALIYVSLAAAWIIVSDSVVQDLAPEAPPAFLLQSFKGLLFVAVSGAVLYLLMFRMTRSRRRIETKLEERDALLRKLSEQVPGVIYQYRLHPDGRSCFPYASEGIRAVYEVTPEQVRESAEDVFAILHPDDLDRIVASINESVAAMSPWTCEYRVILPRRGLRWLEGRSTPERLPDGSTLWHGYIWDVTERRSADDLMRANEAKFRTLVEHAPDAIVILDAEKGCFVEVNKNAERLYKLSREDLLRTGPVALSPPNQPDGRSSEEAALAGVREAIEGNAPVFEWTHRNSAGEDIPCEIRLVRLPSPDRILIRGSVTDIRERKAAERRQALLVQELNHRVKNNLAAVLALAERTFDGAPPAIAGMIAPMRRAFTGRVMALAGLHTLLSQTKWEGVSIRALVEQTLRAFVPAGSPERVRISGPDAALSARAGSSLCMALHELATNAAKYGSLSGAVGAIDVVWKWEGEGDSELHLEWRERGGPPVSPPENRGFGVSLIEHLLAYEIGGTAELHFEPAGVMCDIRVKRSALSGDAWPAVGNGKAAPPAPPASPAPTRGS